MADPQAQTEPEGGSSANVYAILAKLATGGMAELFLARTASSAGVERYVVLKRVLPNRVKDRNFVAMFLDEARLAAQLQHPNIAQVFDTGKLGDSYFFSMEYVHGETVRELIHRSKQIKQPIPLGCALTIVANAAAGLHHAHERLGLDGKPLGIVHRDVSPSNLMVTYEGNVKVVDFGVAKAAHQSAETQTGTVKGKIGYLSPEQCRGRASDRRSDLFSLGIVMWELLIGERMYKRENDYDTMEAIVLDKPEPPSKHRSEIPPELDGVVMKMLAKTPSERYQTADELHEDLERVADAAGIRMSSAALKRYVVELFGKRPEPWIEMQTRDVAEEVVTVSAAVVAGRDTVLTSVMVDSQLLSVPDLTNTPSAPRRTPTPLAFAGLDPDEPLADLARRQAILPSHSLRGKSKKASSQTTLKVRTGKRSPLVWGVTALAFAGVLVVAWSVFGHATGKQDAASGTSVAAIKTPDTKTPDTKTPDTKTPDTKTPDTKTPDTKTPDTKTPDTKTPDIKTPDIKTPDTKTPDTKTPDIKTPDIKTPDTKSSVHRRAADDLAADLRAGKVAEVLAACSTTPKALAQNIVTCTLAACESKNAADSHAWFANVPARQRDSVIAQCAVAGTILETKKAPIDSESKLKPVKPVDCDQNPMACRE